MENPIAMSSRLAEAWAMTWWLEPESVVRLLIKSETQPPINSKSTIWGWEKLGLPVDSQLTVNKYRLFVKIQEVLLHK